SRRMPLDRTNITAASRHHGRHGTQARTHSQRDSDSDPGGLAQSLRLRVVAALKQTRDLTEPDCKSRAPPPTVHPARAIPVSKECRTMVLATVSGAISSR